jgi:hypothetical protein
MNELSFVFQMAFSETLYNDGQTSGDQEKKASNPRATHSPNSTPIGARCHRQDTGF